MARTARVTRSEPAEAPQHQSEPPDAPHDSPSSSSPHQPTLPLELVKDILELCWDDGTPEGRATVISSCSASKAFAGVARKLVWKEVRVDCVNAVKSYKEGHADTMASPYSSSSCWELSPAARCRLDILLGRPDLRALVRVFEVYPPNGVLRSETARMWTTDFGLLQGVVSTLPAVATLGIGWICDPDDLDLQPPPSSDSLQTLFAARVLIDKQFVAAFPNLRRLSLQNFTAERAVKPKRCPPVEYLKVHCVGSELRRLFRSFGSTLVHLWLDQLPTYDDFDVEDSRDPSKLLQSLDRLENLTMTLRDLDTFENEDTTRSSNVSRSRRNYLTAQVSQAFGILATLPRHEQVSLHFALPPLADPKQQRLDKRFWQDFFGRLRDGGTLDAMVPKTVKEVDWSSIFDEEQA